jgi:hypothetical protein
MYDLTVEWLFDNLSHNEQKYLLEHLEIADSYEKPSKPVYVLTVTIWVTRHIREQWHVYHRTDSSWVIALGPKDCSLDKRFCSVTSVLTNLQEAVYEQYKQFKSLKKFEIEPVGME